MRQIVYLLKRLDIESRRKSRLEHKFTARGRYNLIVEIFEDDYQIDTFNNFYKIKTFLIFNLINL